MELIKKSGVPIAAPSANKFGHVSPTKPQHVLKDFEHNDVLIIDGGPCSFGIESTVLKIVHEKSKQYLLLILRKGGVSQESLQKTISEPTIFKDLILRVESKAHVPRPSHNEPESTAPQEAPGMLLKHYSPHVDTYIVDDARLSPVPLAQCGLIDFGKRHSAHKEEMKWYKDLSEKGDIKEAICNIYEFLRQAEVQEEVKAILLVNMKAEDVMDKIQLHKEHLEALYDRMYRSAAGKIIDK